MCCSSPQCFVNNIDFKIIPAGTQGEEETEHLDCAKSSAATLRISCSCERAADVMLYITAMGTKSECEKMIRLMFLFPLSVPAALLTSTMEKKDCWSFEAASRFYLCLVLMISLCLSELFCGKQLPVGVDECISDSVLLL